MRVGETREGVSVYLWRWLIALEFLNVQVLNEIYASKLSIYWPCRNDL